MFPEKIPSGWGNDPGLAAERWVYGALKRQLRDDFSVLWRVPLYDEQSAQRRDSEADFVILHASLGVSVLEVKGGRIDREGALWFSTDRREVRHEIKDPLAQASGAKHTILKQLRATPRFQRRWIVACHAAVLPDSHGSGSASFGPNAPAKLIAFLETMDELGLFVERLMRESANGVGAGLGQNGVREVEEMLAPRFRLTNLA